MSEIKHYDEVGESPEKPIRFEDIERELRPSEMLPHYYAQRDEVERRLRHLGIDEEDVQSLLRYRMHGRIFSHLVRLVQHGGVERTFAATWLEQSPMDKLGDQDDAISSVIGSEGSDVAMFWTFAPYLFQALTAKGVAADKAISMILNWSKTGVSTGNYDRGKRDESWNDIHLKGLEFMNQTSYKQYVLSGDANHPSHKFTAQEARRIADILIAENEK